MPLTLLASSVAVVLGSIWGAVPTPFAAGLFETHELGKLSWLLSGQIGILALASGWFNSARGVVGFSDRLLPASWQPRAMCLAMMMLFVAGGSLVALGLPLLQAPWWLALSLAGYTLACAVWSVVLPRLRPDPAAVIFSQRHRLLGQGQGTTDPLQLAYVGVQQNHAKQLLATMEGLLLAVITPAVGWLIDFYGSVDRVLVITGLCFLLWLTLSTLVCVLRDGTQRHRSEVSRIALHRCAGNSSRMRYSQSGWCIDCKKKGLHLWHVCSI